MRLDKYLKVSRIIKRRSVAKDVATASRIYVNDRLAKPSLHLKENDLIKIIFGNKEVVIKVINLVDSTKKADASLMYELISETRIEQQVSN